MLTWKYALPTFLVPLMFTQPGGLALLWTDTTVLEAAIASISAIAGIAAIVAGVGGYLFRATNLLERVILIVAGLLLLLPTTFGDIAGLVLFAVAVVLQLAFRPAQQPVGARTVRSP